MPILDPVAPADLRKLLAGPNHGLPLLRTDAAGTVRRVLVAEDNKINQKLIGTLLRKRGFSVEVVNNGSDALEELECTDFDIVLMDVQMPVMDGFEATRRIRLTGKGRSIPIVAITANAMKGDQERCLELGMDGYVSKPVNAAELFAAMEALLAPVA